MKYQVIGFTLKHMRQDTEVWRQTVDADAREDAVLWAFACHVGTPTDYATCTLASSEEITFTPAHKPEPEPPPTAPTTRQMVGPARKELAA